MLSVVLVILSGVQLGCVVWLHIGIDDEVSPRRSSLPLVLVGFGLAYDSAIFGLGRLLGEGVLLQALSVGRYLGHVVLTPLLVVWAADLFGLRRRWSGVIVALLLVWGVAADLLDLHLEPRAFGDTLRYVPSTPHGPPLPALIVSVIVLAAGILLWRKNSWPWLALGTAALISTAAVAFTIPPLGNIGEAMLFAAIVATARRFETKKRPACA